MRKFVRFVTVPVVLAIVSVGAGTIGYFLHLPTLSSYSNASTMQLFSEAFFRSLGFLVLTMGLVNTADSVPFVLLTVARFTGLLFFFYAAVAGVGIVFAKEIRPLRIEAWSILSRLPGFDDRGHIVVCGVGDDGYALATEVLKNGQNVVAIDTQTTDRTEALKDEGAIVFTGDASHKNLLVESARLHRADSVFVTAGSDETNSAIVDAINDICKTSDWPQLIDITARIDNRRLRRTLHNETSSTNGIHLRTYNVSEATARELLAKITVDDINSPDERIHIWIVGWTPFSEALVEQLLHLMHYPDGIDRQITVISETPTEVERDIAALSPGIDPEWWDDASMGDFAHQLFPEVDIHPLPNSEMELLCDRTSLYDTIQYKDKLTIFADNTDNRSLRGLLSAWWPKLDDLSRKFDLDAQLAYRSSDNSNWIPSMSVVETISYTDFGDGCSTESVRGEVRDHVARQVALVYHLLYEDNPESILPNCESVPLASGGDIDAIMEWISSLTPDERDLYAEAVWQNIPEYQRESNRYAADHAKVKHRMASVIGEINGEVESRTIRLLAESEHRRWCAEKILDGWEPLPDSKTERWDSDQGEQILRSQRYHPDILPVESLRKEMEGEWDKDMSQVKALLKHPDIIASRE